MTEPSLKSVKAQARALRQALQDGGRHFSHSEALELVARQMGARDWNTLHARLRAEEPPAELSLGCRVRGHYLGQPYSGTITGIAGPPAGHRQVEVVLDRAIDVVRFDSFSNWRRRIRGQIGADGHSPRRTSDGLHHLTVERAP